MTKKKSVLQLAMSLVILGGVFTVVVGILELATLLVERGIPPLGSLASTKEYGILALVLGLVPLAGVGHMKTVIWNVALLVVGLIGYPLGRGFPWSWGPILIMVGGTFGDNCRVSRDKFRLR